MPNNNVLKILQPIAANSARACQAHVQCALAGRSTETLHRSLKCLILLFHLAQKVKYTFPELQHMAYISLLYLK